MGSYNQDRANWTKAVQDVLAVPIYEKIWPGCFIEPVDQYAESSMRWRRRDFSGLDKIIVLPSGNEIHLAQRFRSSDSGNDFSLRHMVPDAHGGRQESEYFKLLNAYENDHWRPDKFAFGQTAFGLDAVPSEMDGGFSCFYVFNLDLVLEAITTGALQAMGPYSNKDGSTGVYFKINQFPREAIFYEDVSEKDVVSKKLQSSFLM